jgi:hypothetical protein
MRHGWCPSAEHSGRVNAGLRHQVVYALPDVATAALAALAVALDFRLRLGLQPSLGLCVIEPVVRLRSDQQGIGPATPNGGEGRTGQQAFRKGASQRRLLFCGP